eukprot:COSAG05_NODE_2450_length_3052_cov_3.028446_2_plen_117_part_00
MTLLWEVASWVAPLYDGIRNQRSQLASEAPCAAVPAFDVAASVGHTGPVIASRSGSGPSQVAGKERSGCLLRFRPAKSTRSDGNAAVAEPPTLSLLTVTVRRTVIQNQQSFFNARS